ncbi:MAG: FAD-binding oxidoreductase, partial [Myxococcales bacterium]|nr:FAD-binding oxidoreductase [Myxococcales bacterium]
QAGYRPSVVRLYDAFDALLHKLEGDHDDEPEVGPSGMLGALKGHLTERFGGVVKTGVSKVAKSLIRRALGAPMLLNTLVSKVPVGVLLVVGFEGAPGVTQAEADAAIRGLLRQGKDLGSEAGEHWFENRFSVSYKLSPMMDTGAFTDTMEVSTTWDNLQNLYHSVRSAIGRHAFVMAHFSHVYTEGCSIYFTFAGFAPEGEPIEALYERTWNSALRAARSSGSSMAHHHGVGYSKAAHMSGDHRGGSPLNALLKERFDPAGVMNPGKLWDVRQVELEQ